MKPSNVKKYGTSLFCFVFISGCLFQQDQFPVGSVSGKVTVNKKPLADCLVVFSNAKLGIGASTTLDESGMYRLETPLRVGEYQVAIMAPPLPPPDETASSSTKAPSRLVNLPDALQNPDTSGLTVVIEEGMNIKNFQWP